MAATVQITDLSAAVLGAIEAAVAVAVRTTADEMAEALRLEMQAPKSGVVYGTHQASAPGEVPATDTGALMATIHADTTGPFAAEYMMGDEATHYYVDALEYGTSGGRIAARPVMHPSVEVAKLLLPQNVTEAVKEVLK